jgi:peptidoglycan/xylan/chitin deacetylase (PgdA/CDA1 family)
MSRKSTKLLKGVLSALHYTRADNLMAPLTRGVGVIFMLHHVRPEIPGVFEPNRILKVTPQFLEDAICYVLDAGFDVLSIDDVHYRMTEGDFERPFACFTFDDGYRDNHDHAYPIFKRYGLPFTIYVPSDFPDGHGELWWLALEKLISEVDALQVKMDGKLQRFQCATPDAKDRTFNTIYWWLRSIDEHDARQFIVDVCRGIGFNPSVLCSELIMTWDELRVLARDPLVTIGAHTRGHYALAKLSLSQARAEMADSIKRIEYELGRPCEHFSYPYGCERSAGPRDFELARELGLKTAVTTQKGLLHAPHADALTALPRLSLNGDYQHTRYLKVLLNGAPFALLNAVKKAKAMSVGL